MRIVQSGHCSVQAGKCEKLHVSFPVMQSLPGEDHTNKGSFDWDSRLESCLCGALRVARGEVFLFR